MVIRLIELYDKLGSSGQYDLREVYVNPAHVVATLYLSDHKSTLHVVGDMDYIKEKLYKDTRELLKG